MDRVTAPVTTLPPHVTSHSALGDISSCGQAYKLKRIDRVSQLPAHYNHGGTAFHAGADLVDEKFVNGREVEWLKFEAIQKAQETLVEQFAESRETSGVEDDDQWLVAKKGKPKTPAGENLDWWLGELPGMVEKYVDWRVAHPELVVYKIDFSDDEMWLPPEPAIELEVNPTIAGIQRRGFIDVIYQNTDTGVLLICDRKTGGSMPKNDQQLGTYAFALRQQYGVSAYWGAFYKARQGQLSNPYDLTGWLDGSRLDFLYGSGDRKVAEQKFDPVPGADIGKWPCNFCSVKHHCNYVN